MTVSGSSPHPRGALQPHGHRIDRIRIIPASAGSTGGDHDGHPPIEDHPRIRGEHGFALRWTDCVSGSSPHPRGAPSPVVPSGGTAGIIPASARSTRRRPAWWRLMRDHPRIRGEHSMVLAWSASNTGSSPHPRGAHHGPQHRQRRPGIIPASAGSTTLKPPDQTTRQDHPRIRGEHVIFYEQDADREGSSPHPRGAQAPIP